MGHCLHSKLLNIQRVNSIIRGNHLAEVHFTSWLSDRHHSPLRTTKKRWKIYETWVHKFENKQLRHVFAYSNSCTAKSRIQPRSCTPALDRRISFIIGFKLSINKPIMITVNHRYINRTVSEHLKVTSTYLHR